MHLGLVSAFEAPGDVVPFAKSGLSVSPSPAWGSPDLRAPCPQSLLEWGNGGWKPPARVQVHQEKSRWPLTRS